MGIYVQITKLKQINEMHYYDVDTDSFEYKKPFFIGKDEKNKKLFFFSDNLNKSLYSIDLINHPSSLENKYLPFSLIYRIFKKARQAVEKSEYPEFLDYAA